MAVHQFFFLLVPIACIVCVVLKSPKCHSRFQRTSRTLLITELVTYLKFLNRPSAKKTTAVGKFRNRPSALNFMGEWNNSKTT